MAKPFNELKRKKITVALTEADEDIYNFFVNTKNSSSLVRRLLLTYMLRPKETEAIMRGDISFDENTQSLQYHNRKMIQTHEVKAQLNKKKEIKNIFEITEEDEKILKEEEIAVTLENDINKAKNVIMFSDIKNKTK